MRRGHPGIGGWRSENPRHFKPRGPGGPRFRNPRPYSPLENPPFPPIPRPHRPSQHYNTHSGHDNHGPSDHPGLSDHHDRSKYRINNQRNMDRGPHPRTRPNYPPYQNMRQVDNDIQESTYKNSSNFYRDKDKYHVNNMGDIDHRLTPHGTFNEPYSQQLPQMSNPPPGLRKQYFEDRNLQKNYRHETGDGNQIPLEYAGHRPPASDHYGTPSTMANNNNTAFSRSVDDTVDIIRKRMLNRNESLPLLQDSDIQDNNDQQTGDHANQLSQPEQPAKKRPPRQRQTVKANCDKMKTNIVQQLFKMDKDRIHKLMDNPSSSTKFEYAISSLITESQNSLNQHMRSVAEKSLSSTSTDFMQSDNNTIYEDTFMKQMQGLLDPQDTVLLEDIKPLVMAELSKVLQLNDFDHRFEVPDDSFAMLPVQDEQSNYPYDMQYHYDDYYYNRPYDQDEQSNFEHADRVNIPDEVNPDFNFINEPPPEQDKPLFERRTARKSNQSDHSEEKKLSAEQRRMSLERRRLSSEVHTNEETVGLFDTNTEQQSEEDDPFAELDRQYHVAVDHNFIANEDLSARNTPNNMQVIQKDSIIKTEIDELQTIIPPSKNNISSKDSHDKRLKSNTNIKLEVLQSPDFPKENSTPLSYTENINPIEHVPIKQEYNRGVITTDRSTENQDNLNVSKTSPSNSRKRSIDQRPSHRKEKRKKSESRLSTESAKSSNGKIDSVNEEPRRLTEKCKDATKPPYYNIFTIKSSNKETSKDNKHADIADKNYSDKYVKRKETHKKSKEKESYSSRKRHNSTSNTILSPKDSNNQTSKDSNIQTPSKSDPKTKLKHIDMFSEKTKKVTLHQAHRNTTSMTPKHSSDDNKPKTTPMRKSATTKHVSTQVLKKVTTRETQTFESKSVSSRFSQTERKKTITRFAQTDPVSFEKPPEKPRSTDAFERMKEIDMEIQVLLQEKFKLYSSLESKESCSSSMPTLGMTVLNVAPVEEIKEEEEDLDSDSLISADTIVDDFTNIPVEELEQIALETVHEENTTPKIEKKNLRQKVLQRERKTSESPTSSRRNKKGKTPNISLIEQIITDERPLDDIICLDDLEKPENKNRKKKQGSKALPKKKVTKKTQKSVDPPIHYDLKECSVVLIQTDVTQFLRNIVPEAEEMVVAGAPDAIPQYLEEPPKTEYSSKATEVVEEAVVNDMNLDMLDVSEDIVIGDICEIKCQDGKDVHETIDLSLNLNEDIILDNSQLSAEDAVANEAGQSDVCKMYDYSTDEKLRRDSLTVTGNSDAVLAIECIENGFIAACLDGNVYHFSLDGQLMNTMRGSSLAVTCLTIVKEKYGTTVYTGSLDSRIRYYDLETGLEKGPECNVLSPIQTMDRAWDTVFVGTRTGFVLQFECKNNMLIPVSTVKFSEQTILALRAMKEGPRKVLLVAARSEPVTIKDAQTGLLLRTLVGPKMTVYSLMFEDGKVYCGTSSHQIHVYDYSTGQHAGCHEGGKGAVCLRATGGLLFAGCYDGCVYIYREGETRPLAQLRGPSLMLLSLAVIGSKIIAGYKDRSVYIWKIPLSVLQEMIL